MLIFEDPISNLYYIQLNSVMTQTMLSVKQSRFHSCYSSLYFILRNRRRTASLTNHAAHNKKCCAAQ